MQGGTDSSEFRIPDSELGGSVELRVPSPQPSRLTPVPSDKILFPRRMLYVEAVLYVTVAAAAFGLGYLAGRGGPPVAAKEAADNVDVQRRVPVEGRVLLAARAGVKRGDVGAVVIAFPAGKLPATRLPIAGLRPADPPPAAGDATSGALASQGGAAVRADASGVFTLFVPAAGSYRVLVLSRQASREVGVLPEQRDIADLEKYFDAPADLLQRCRYRWFTAELRRGAGSLDVDFTE